jgi:hypothetical protein
MKRNWSISTTVRNAERIRNFLIALQDLNGEVWDEQSQIKYQVLLIQKRFYGLTNQFFNDLSAEHISVLKSPDDIDFETAREIFYSKNYTDPAMRGRQSFNPLKKMGLVNIVNQRIQITSLGDYLLRNDYDLGEMFFRSFIKWQLPNLDSDDFNEEEGFCIKPFVGTLHLIKKVNTKWQNLGKEPKGISKDEFSLFGPTLISFQDIETQAQRIVSLRLNCEGRTGQEQKEITDQYKQEFAREIIGDVGQDEVVKFLSNLKDYGDNALRYFRLTRYLYIRGGGFYIDLEPRRHIEIEALLQSDNAAPLDFSNKEQYQNYISDIAQPVLPWETDRALKEIAMDLVSDLIRYGAELDRSGIRRPEFSSLNIEAMSVSTLKGYIEELREKRRKLQELFVHFESQRIEKIELYIQQLENIHDSDAKKSIELERLTTLALNALNDALEINPNYPVGDDNEPTFTAPANKADIECFYEMFNSVCEVTMLTDRSQWYNEGQPVMRHVRDFEDKHNQKNVYCLFVAPRLHQDTVETFWMSIKYGYRGRTQRIIPFSITQIVRLLKTLLSLKRTGKPFNHAELLDLYDGIIGITNDVERSDDWISRIPEKLQEWEEELLNRV